MCGPKEGTERSKLETWTQFLIQVAAGVCLFALERFSRSLARNPALTLSLKNVYFLRFLDFYLIYARPAFFAIIAFVLLLNLLGVGVIRATQGILFLDSTGTALAAFTLGPWWAAAIGILTNLVGTYITGAQTYYQLFGVVNALIGVAWGYYAMFRRRDVTQANVTSVQSFFRTSIYLGTIAVLVSSPLASYLLYYHLNVPTNESAHTADNFQAALFEALSNASGGSVSGPPSMHGYLLFLLCQIPFNLVDKTASALLGLILLQLLFPIVRVLDRVAETMNFIKSSSGSHLVFAVVYVGFYLALNHGDLPTEFLALPLVVCVISYLGMAAFVPKSLHAYEELAKYFQNLQLPPDQRETRGRLLRAAAIALLVVLAYTGLVVGVGLFFKMKLETAIAVIRSVISVLMTRFDLG